MICKSKMGSPALEQAQGGGLERPTFKSCAARVLAGVLRTKPAAKQQQRLAEIAEAPPAVYAVDIARYVLVYCMSMCMYVRSLCKMAVSSGKCLDDDGGRVGPRTGHKKRAAGSSVDNRHPSFPGRPRFTAARPYLAITRHRDGMTQAVIRPQGSTLADSSDPFSSPMARAAIAYYLGTANGTGSRVQTLAGQASVRGARASRPSQPQDHLMCSLSPPGKQASAMQHFPWEPQQAAALKCRTS